jgi:hypothetical protein
LGASEALETLPLDSARESKETPTSTLGSSEVFDPLILKSVKNQAERIKGSLKFKKLTEKRGTIDLQQNM